MNLKTLLLLTLTGAAALGANGARILHVPMEPASRESIRETVGDKNLFLYSKFVPESPAGAAGNALRFDGFSSYAQGNVNAGSAEASTLTFALWVAPETYPVIALDTPTEEKICLAGTYDESAKKGWRFALGYTGKYAFECYSKGWKVTVEATEILPRTHWSHLVVVADGASKQVTLYRDGIKVGQAKSMGSIDNSATKLTIGKSPETSMVGPFMINTFNGLLDELEVFDTALSETEIKAYTAEHPADLSIPESRYADQKMRPRFHGMPATAWTNECHGMTYSNGRYHVFFQKNANGPYMTRLHWGHISSANLLDWREEQIALAPGNSYDVKGCWSGCIVNDPALAADRPVAIYTGVDYEKARICMAIPSDEDLLSWSYYGSNPLINGRPSGLSDDFRDPYFFRNGDDAYIIVGSSKNGKGVTTLHKMNPTTKTFDNSGKIFFEATDASKHGTFWEMPNVTPLGDGRWIFTVTPLGTSDGVKCLYWVGTIASDGTFTPQTEARPVELESRDGYGLLSPTIYQHDGKTLALGIVPDKLPGDKNYSLGWAHCYSLPREWSVDASGNLWQKPYSGVASMRKGAGFSMGERDLTGESWIEIVDTRQVEIKARFEVGSAPFGIRFLKEGKLYYNPSTGELIADLTGINRWSNDGGVYSGIYRMKLPEKPAVGSELQIDLFVDGSIIDIFVNDRYAQSIRVFAEDNVAGDYMVYAEGTARLKSLQAWNLDVASAGVGDIMADAEWQESPTVDVYDISGRLVLRNADRANVTSRLDSGLYLIDGKKTLIR